MSDRAKRIRSLAANVLAACLSLGVTWGIAEWAIRSVPALLPAGTYTLGQRFEPAIEAPVYDGKVIYNKVRRVERISNSAGFMDAEHEIAKPPGVTRVGIFGDSYVESLQVPVEDTFVRRAGRMLAPESIELLALGISGWGTLHSHLAWRGLAPRYDLDTIVYVFVENDLGDNAWSIMSQQRTTYLRRPFAVLDDAPPGWRILWRDDLDARSPLVSALRRATDSSLLARVVWGRAVLLFTYGISGRPEARAYDMGGLAGAIPNQNDLPSTWPDSYAEQARELGRRILGEWTRQARERGQDFLVLYVPRGQSQLRGEPPVAETWKPWLLATCADLDIPVIDPSEALRRRMLGGDDVYDDHWSPAGHEVVSEVLSDALRAHHRRPRR
jgi:hypothetical protein